MMIVHKIEWLEKSILEARVALKSEEKLLICFAHPFHQNEGEELIGEVHAYEATSVERYMGEAFFEGPIKNWEYRISGKLIDLKEGIVDTGSFVFFVDPDCIPKDIFRGEKIRMTVERFDIW